MHNLEVFAAKVCNKKTLKGNNPSELVWDIYFEDVKKKDIKMRKCEKGKAEISIWENPTNFLSIPSTYQTHISTITNI